MKKYEIVVNYKYIQKKCIYLLLSRACYRYAYNKLENRKLFDTKFSKYSSE